MLIVFVAETVRDGKPMTWALYDTGQVAAHFTVQAHADGLSTHQMGGFDRDAIAAGFGLGEDFTPVTVMAVGALGDIRDGVRRAAGARERAARAPQPRASRCSSAPRAALRRR